MASDSSLSPSVSVVMLAYNHGPYIQQAIEGVLSQKTDFPVELLIGEDHSPDNTLEIARRYERAHPGRVRVITSDHNVGAKKNSQRLEAACTGKYMAYCEGDDYWHDPKKLQKQVGFLEAHPEYSLVYAEYRTYFVATGRWIQNEGRQPRDLDDADAYNEMLAGRRVVLTLTACVRSVVMKEVLQTCPECYDPQYLMGDTQRWLEVARRGRVKCLHEVVATHLALPESASRSNNPEKSFRFSRSARAMIDHYVDKYEAPPAVKRAARLRSAIWVLNSAARLGDPHTAKAVLNELRLAGISPSLRARLLYLGSRSPMIKKISRHLFPGIVLGEKVVRRIQRIIP